MYLVTVIPIGKGMGKETLTYFSNGSLPKGSVVEIPIRNKSGFGLVIDSTPAEENKSAIKNLSFSMKKIDALKAQSFKDFLSPGFIKSTIKISDYYATTMGAVLFSLVPKVILENSDKLNFEYEERAKNVVPEILLLQANEEERFGSYKSLIREEFAKNRSVLFILPTIENVTNAKALLEKGIDRFTYVLHSELGDEILVDTWKKILEEKHPVLIICTGYFLSIPRNDLGTIIVDKESSRGYNLPLRPHIDIRTAAKIIAKESGKRLVLGDLFLRVETLFQKDTYAELEPLKFKFISESQSELVDMRTAKDFKKKDFAILSDKLKEIVLATAKKKQHLFLFCSRKGLYPTTVCSDCGTVVACDVCSAPVVLYTRKQQNTFVCHHCGQERPADTKCKYCGGWRLTTLGIGVDKVVQEVEILLKKENVELPLFILDKDHVSTHKKAIKIRNHFYKNESGVMIGTELALSYLNNKIDNAAIVSLDSLFSIPDFRINEKIFHILLDMRNLVDKSLYIQTRQKNTKIFDEAIKGNLMDFYRDEIKDRKDTNYPPFSTCIKLTISGTSEKKILREKMQGTIDEIKADFPSYEFMVFDGVKTSKGHVVHGLVTLPKERWTEEKVDEKLLEKLRSLPLFVTIKIDPDTLL